MSSDIFVKSYVNPLALLEVDMSWAGIGDQPVSHETILRAMCTPGLDSDVAAIIERYKEISTEKFPLSVVPAEKNILEKIVWPLRHAKYGYILGNYIGTISLSGMVSEMLCILLFDIASFQINGQPMTEEKQKSIWGRVFERLGQEQRINILHAYNLIAKDQKEKLEKVKDIRKKYLHFFSQDIESAQKDSLVAFQITVELVANAFIEDIKEGKFIVNPRLIQYLTQHGITEPVP